MGRERERESEPCGARVPSSNKISSILRILTIALVGLVWTQSVHAQPTRTPRVRQAQQIAERVLQGGRPPLGSAVTFEGLDVTRVQRARRLTVNYNGDAVLRDGDLHEVVPKRDAERSPLRDHWIAMVVTTPTYRGRTHVEFWRDPSRALASVYRVATEYGNGTVVTHAGHLSGTAPAIGPAIFRLRPATGERVGFEILGRLSNGERVRGRGRYASASGRFRFYGHSGYVQDGVVPRGLNGYDLFRELELQLTDRSVWERVPSVSRDAR